jgi:hypothetical protein
MVGFGLVYTGIAVVDAVLMIRFSRRELPAVPTAQAGLEGQSGVPAVQY